MNFLQSKAVLCVLLVGVLGYAMWPWLVGSDLGPVYYGTANFAHIGSGADDQATVDFMVQADKIYIDQNNDDVPQADELTSDQPFQLGGDGGNSQCQIQQIRLAVSPESVSESLPQKLLLYAEFSGEASYRQTGSVSLTKQPGLADPISFGEPLTLIFDTPEFALVKSDLANPILLMAATQGSANEAAAAGKFAHVVPTAGDLAPKLKVEYESDESDSEPVVQEIVLDQFC